MFYALDSEVKKQFATLTRSEVQTKLISECVRCGLQKLKPDGVIQLGTTTSGTYWPDAAHCLGVFHGFYVSQRVKSQLDDDSVRYGIAFSAQVRLPDSKRLKDINPPSYYYLAGEFGAKYDFSRAGMTIESVCPECGDVKR